MNSLLKITLVILLSTVKFIGGPALAYHYRFNFIEIIFYTVLGGMTGVVLMSYFSPWIVVGWELLKNLFRRKDRHVYAKPTVDLKGNIKIKYIYVSVKSKKKPLFTPTNRRMVRMWKRYGLIGIAALTPVLFSIPLGTFFATRMGCSRENVFLYMFVSILIWSVIITAALYKLIPLPGDMLSQ